MFTDSARNTWNAFRKTTTPLAAALAVASLSILPVEALAFDFREVALEYEIQRTALKLSDLKTANIRPGRKLRYKPTGEIFDAETAKKAVPHTAKKLQELRSTRNRLRNSAQ